MRSFRYSLKKLLPLQIVNFYRNIIAGNNPPIGSFQEIEIRENLVCSGGELNRIFLNHNGKFAIKWTHYIDIYEELLAPFKLRSQVELQGQSDQIRLLEIGVFHGGSLEIWKSYFGDDSRIFGIDINPNCADLEIPGVQIRIGSQIDQQFLADVIRELGNPHIIIDDGSHHSSHISKTLEYLWPHLEEGGIYVVEDTHASYWKEYGGGLRKQQSIIEFIKDGLDTLHHHYTRKEMPHRTAFLKNSVSSVTIYDSIIVIRKKRTSAPKLFSVGCVSNPKNQN